MPLLGPPFRAGSGRWHPRPRELEARSPVPLPLERSGLVDDALRGTVAPPSRPVRSWQPDGEETPCDARDGRMEEHSAQDFYDDLAGEYDLIFSDWDGEVGRQGEALDALLGRELGPRGLSVLDCSCGIGTQAIGLALRGHLQAMLEVTPIADRAVFEHLATLASQPRAQVWQEELEYFIEFLLAEDAKHCRIPPEHDAFARQRQLAAELRKVLPDPKQVPDTGLGT